GCFVVWTSVSILCMFGTFFVVFFFFSSRRRHTRCYRDWSSDVCSSDLGGGGAARRPAARARARDRADRLGEEHHARGDDRQGQRSEERRVGKECRSRGSGCQAK